MSTATTTTTTHRFTPGYDHAKTLSSEPLVLNPAQLVHPGEDEVPAELYSGFIEHLGRCIYGGVVDDPAHPADPALLIPQEKGRLGWRKDVMGYLARDGELQTQFLRWPGGNFVSNYNWQDGIGPVENRPVRAELAWLVEESNKFGTDEFIDYARALGVEPYLCFNFGTGTLSDALSWIEYCNGTGNTYWANLRRKNTGRHEPHNVKLWGLGNEMWGEWQVGHLSAADYVTKARSWAHAIRLVDPSVKLVSCGEDGVSDWDREVIQGMISVCDYHSLHMYTVLRHEKIPGIDATVGSYENNVFGPCAAEMGIAIAAAQIDLATIVSQEKGKPFKPMKICYDEWNVWDEVSAPGSGGVEQIYNYTDALGFCAWLNVLVRKSKDIKIACIAQSVNVIAPIRSSPKGVVRQTIYWPYKLFTNFMKHGYLISTAYGSDIYTGLTHRSWIKTLIKPTYIDMVAIYIPVSSTNKTASIRLSVLNRSPVADWEGGFRLDGFEVESADVYELYSDDLDASNDFDHPQDVEISNKKLSASEWKDQGGKWVVKKHSWSFFMLEGKVGK